MIHNTEERADGGLPGILTLPCNHKLLESIYMMSGVGFILPLDKVLLVMRVIPIIHK
jgi:hypothetical protein